MSSEPLTICPKCAKPSLKRLMSSGVGLIFKGSGFYITDYKKSNTSTGSGPKTESKPEAGSGSKPDSKKESKTGSKKESKPETPPPSKPPADTSSSADKK